MNILDRLPEALRKEPVWVEVMECFSEVLQPLFERVEKIEKSNSIFTADEKNLDLIIEEAGQVFDVEWNSPEDKPLAVLRRKDELKFKTTAIPIESMLNRAFVGLSSYWDQFYCKKTDPYLVENLITRDSIREQNGNIDDYFLTSRGFLRIDTATMLDRGITQAEVSKVIKGMLSGIIPLHVVFDGIRFILSVIFSDMSLNASAVFKAKQVTTGASIAIDLVAKESLIILPVATDEMNVYAQHEVLNFDEVPLDFWPLDMPLIINDGLTIVDGVVETPMPMGQLGSGIVDPVITKQLGDGSKPPSKTTQISEI